MMTTVLLSIIACFLYEVQNELGKIREIMQDKSDKA